MCRTLTPEDKQVACSRCGNAANPNDGWEHEWPLYGRLHVGFPAQAFAALCGKRIAGEDQFRAWNKGHPSMVKNGAQDVVFEWGNGVEYDSTDRYRLCYECQRVLLGVIGEFFGYGERTGEE